MSTNSKQHSFRATLLSGVSGLALMGAVAALPGAALAQGVIVDSGGGLSAV